MTQDIFIQEYQLLPEHLKQEVLDFLLFLKSKHGLQKNGMALEEPAGPVYGKAAGQVEHPRPVFGGGDFKITLSPDFDEPLEGFVIPKPASATTGKPKPYFGKGKVKFTLAPDFDEPLEDFKEYME